MDRKKLNLEEVLKIYDQTRSQTETAKHFGVKLCRIHALLHKQRVPIYPAKHDNPRKRIYDHDQVVALFEQTQNQREVARRLGMNQSNVSLILRSRGIHVGTGGTTLRKDVPKQEIVARYLAGESMVQLGKAFGVDPEMLRKRLQRAGIARRKPGGHGLTADKNSQYKGGYKAPMHYYRRQSYEVAAICLGQPLAQGLVIHHLDENAENNHHSNLWIFPSQGHHAGFHQKQLRLLREGQQVDAIQLLRESGAVPLPPPPAPIEYAPGTGHPALSGTELLERLRQRALQSKQGPYGRLPTRPPDDLKG